MSNDTFANPLPPPNYVPPHSRDESNNLTNDDFRKLLMTPSASSSNREKSALNSKKIELSSSKKKFASESAERRKEKKLYYASLMKEVKEREAELAQKYRDRAKERRENEKTQTHDTDYQSTTGNFRAVGPDFTLNENADRRRQLIEESKYLGGDLEHTHLVKGLDYALLQKIKAEIEKKQQDVDLEDEQAEKKEDSDEKSTDDEEEVDDISNDLLKANLKPKITTKTANATLASALTKSFQDQTGLKKNLEELKQAQKTAQKLGVKLTEKEESDEDETKIVFKTKLARNIYRVMFESKPPKVNELFAPNRMAYVVDLNEEEVDVPVTCMRSKADCPNNETNSSVTTNDIVINKLTQILSYLRHGKRDAKKNKKKLVKNEEIPDIKEKPVNSSNDFSIYDDIGDYVPTITKSNDGKKSDSTEYKKRNYFGDNTEEDKEGIQGPSREAACEFIKNINEKYANKEAEVKKEEKKTGGMAVQFDADSYSECYPGTRAEEDVNIDSDEEDFSKMDMGNKKGPVNRWDFDTNEEYGSYMDSKEANPKAAFQFGLKMTDGRKTRRLPGEEKKNDKVKLDKEWAQISKLIDKRKQSGGGGDYKKPKY